MCELSGASASTADSTAMACSLRFFDEASSASSVGRGPSPPGQEVPARHEHREPISFDAEQELGTGAEESVDGEDPAGREQRGQSRQDPALVQGGRGVSDEIAAEDDFVQESGRDPPGGRHDHRSVIS